MEHTKAEILEYIYSYDNYNGYLDKDRTRHCFLPILGLFLYLIGHFMTWWVFEPSILFIIISTIIIEYKLTVTQNSIIHHKIMSKEYIKSTARDIEDIDKKIQKLSEDQTRMYRETYITLTDLQSDIKSSKDKIIILNNDELLSEQKILIDEHGKLHKQIINIFDRIGVLDGTREEDNRTRALLELELEPLQKRFDIIGDRLEEVDHTYSYYEDDEDIKDFNRGYKL